jgi:hypothetical protein
MVDVRVAFDDECADVVTHKTYFKALDKYNAFGTGHSNGTSTMSFLSKPDLTKLKRDLGDIKILEVYE